AQLADEFTRQGHSVSLLAGSGAVLPELPCETGIFRDFASLDSLLRARLGESSWDLVIHLAAVSDYSLQWVDVGQGARPVDTGRKLSSTASEMTLGLKRNFKIVDRLREYASGGSREREPGFVAFKLTQGASDEERDLQ